MKPRAAKTRFLKRLEAAGQSLDALTPAAGVEATLAYYADERADGCPLDEEGTCSCSNGARTIGAMARPLKSPSPGSSL
jgi:hypothetical protein